MISEHPCLLLTVGMFAPVPRCAIVSLAEPIITFPEFLIGQHGLTVRDKLSPVGSALHRIFSDFWTELGVRRVPLCVFVLAFFNVPPVFLS